MAEDNRVASIADASKPNAGRIYDFVLGGNHNFEVDRLAAQEMMKTNPGMQKTARTIRWFLGEAIRRLLAEGFTQFIDFASGLPTVDHIHQVAPKGTKVVYSDIDPVTVAYGQEIIKDNPEVRYIVCNIASPEKLLEDSTVIKFLDRNRKTAIGVNGIAWFLKDDDLRHAFKSLYDWSEKGTRLYVSDYDHAVIVETEATKIGTANYKKTDSPLNLRPLASLRELIKPWKVMEPGFKPLEDWIGIDGGAAREEQRLFGGNCVGAILEK